jgi:anthranilate phosphoribosyltransferase
MRSSRGNEEVSQLVKAESRDLGALGLLDANHPARSPTTGHPGDRSKRARQVTAVAIIGATLGFWAMLLWALLG